LSNVAVFISKEIFRLLLPVRSLFFIFACILFFVNAKFDAYKMLADIQQLLRAEESETLEFKQPVGEIREIIETAGAFVNGQGGTIVIGVTSSGKVLGVDIGKDTLESLANSIQQQTDVISAWRQKLSRHKSNGKSAGNIRSKRCAKRLSTQLAIATIEIAAMSKCAFSMTALRCGAQGYCPKALPSRTSIVLITHGHEIIASRGLSFSSATLSIGAQGHCA
jgi:GTPase